MTNTTRKFGWKKDKVDPRDYKFKAERLAPLQTVYLAHTYNLGKVFDQGDLGSCTANGLAFAGYFDLLNKNVTKTVSPFIPSRLAIYYWERALEGTVTEDAGAEIRDGVKVININGLPSEDLWPYTVSQFAVAPPASCVTYGAKLTALRYESVDNTNKQLIITALVQGLPVVFGTTVYSSFMTEEVEQTGIVPMPNTATEQVQGGHCMVIVGYDVTLDAFIVRNSWGTGWGQGGYCRIPAAYITSADLCSDFWVVYTLSVN